MGTTVWGRGLVSLWADGTWGERGLEVVTSAPFPALQNLQLAVSCTARADALNASTSVTISTMQ